MVDDINAIQRLSAVFEDCFLLKTLQFAAVYNCILIFPAQSNAE
ncbi:hypothetical protein L798_07909 [Zootermopsis nevadensis]|uniref:Uncharacterized protein n=1 Tax=Zootermopsis nevadensis TaxID=136037 RepID=A0A067RLQ7_ZOONE|nr:hypothetical protein L798_07909 [Zootermopsis nevadensis]